MKTPREREPESMKIVAIMGSPREGGNSDVMLNAFLSSRDSRHHLEWIVPSRLNLGFCRGCRFCEAMGRCILRDDMDGVGNKLLEADKVVLSSPIFFYGFPASLKALIDRTQVFWSRKYKMGEKFKYKEGFLLAVGATRGEKLFEGIVLTTRYFFDAWGCEYKGGLFFRGFDQKGAIGECQKCLEEIKEAGKSFLRSEDVTAPTEPS